MPLDYSYYIKDMNPANPVGTVDKVSELDDAIREVKGVILNTFPEMDGEVEYSTDDLNTMKANLSYETETVKNTVKEKTTESTFNKWDMKGNALDNVAELDKDTAVQPRKTNDKRYLTVENNLSDIKDLSKAFDNLFKTVDYTSDGVKAFRTVMANLMYPVGTLYFNVQTTQNPSEYLGVGTWVKYAEGRALIGTGECHDGQTTRKFGPGDTTGTFQHTMTVEEMPAHTHPFKALTNVGPGPDTKHNFPIAQMNHTTYNTESVGGSKPHNNVQPSIAVHIWRRTA